MHRSWDQHQGWGECWKEGCRVTRECSTICCLPFRPSRAARFFSKYLLVFWCYYISFCDSELLVLIFKNAILFTGGWLAGWLAEWLVLFDWHFQYSWIAPGIGSLSENEHIQSPGHNYWCINILCNRTKTNRIWEHTGQGFWGRFSLSVRFQGKQGTHFIERRPGPVKGSLYGRWSRLHRKAREKLSES